LRLPHDEKKKRRMPQSYKIILQKLAEQDCQNIANHECKTDLSFT